MPRLLTFAAEDRIRPLLIWRYMSLGRFIWLLERKALWFSRADLLGDKWEGMPTKAQIDELLATWEADVAAGKTTPYGNRNDARAALARIVAHFPLNSYVNCWSFQPAESYAMWRVYCPTSESIAIRTSVGRLADSLPERVEFVRVRYEANPKFIPPWRFSLLSQKRPAFEYEKEMRALIPALDPIDGDIKAGLFGEAIPWDPGHHVEEIRIHPQADAATIHAIGTTVATFAPGLIGKVAISEMAFGPETAWQG
jgi:hypothetical protein